MKTRAGKEKGFELADSLAYLVSRGNFIWSWRVFIHVALGKFGL